jgi:hypothetical protein
LEELGIYALHGAAARAGHGLEAARPRLALWSTIERLGMLLAKVHLHRWSPRRRIPVELSAPVSTGTEHAGRFPSSVRRLFENFRLPVRKIDVPFLRVDQP